ncbi:MAG: histidine triad nucleotide-binding protein [Gammaproteobacteria bacterium]|nr:histidine triad nucleotide-binding protein [Gammaproteobacteria bacterium]MDE2344833.1 histidine triad nucleotide-binding protein [Gammaproteobacteria bacterium]
MKDCLFCKMVAGEIKPDMVMQNDQLIAFRDINPQAATHILVVPRRHISTLNDLAQEDAGIIESMVSAARTIAHQQGIAASGYRLVMNCNQAGGQTVYHIHLHLLGGRPMGWPPG